MSEYFGYEMARKPGGNWTSGDYSKGSVPYFNIDFPVSTMQDDFFSKDNEVWNKVPLLRRRKSLQPYGMPRYINTTYPPGF